MRDLQVFLQEKSLKALQRYLARSARDLRSKILDSNRSIYDLRSYKSSEKFLIEDIERSLKALKNVHAARG